MCFGDGVFAFESLDFGFAGFECGGCGGIAAGGEAVGAVAEGHEFQRRFVAGALGDGEFRAGELLVLASTLRNAISPVQTLTSLPGWLLWSCHALGLWECSKSMELTLQGLPMTALPLSLAL